MKVFFAWFFGLSSVTLGSLREVQRTSKRLCNFLETRQGSRLSRTQIVLVRRESGQIRLSS